MQFISGTQSDVDLKNYRLIDTSSFSRAFTFLSRLRANYAPLFDKACNNSSNDGLFVKKNPFGCKNNKKKYYGFYFFKEIINKNLLEIKLDHILIKLEFD